MPHHYPLMNHILSKTVCPGVVMTHHYPLMNQFYRKAEQCARSGHSCIQRG